MRKISLLMLMMSILCTFSFQKEVNNQRSENSIPAVAHATWRTHYENKQEMIEEADLVVYGEIISQYCEQREDLIFTKSIVEIEKNYKGAENMEYIEILQTGGSMNGIETPAIAEAPLFEIGENALWVLEKAEETSKYGSYYLIAGGYQGVYFENYNASNLTELLNELPEVKQGNIKKRIWERYWKRSSIDFSYFNVERPTIVNAAMLSWNGIANIGYYYTGTIDARVQIEEHSYSDVSWHGISYIYPDSSQVGREIVGADIRINNYKMDTSSDFQYQAVVCHEAGHCLGMMGHQPIGTESVMQEYTESYWNKYKTPTSTDRATIQGMYPKW